MIPGDTIFNFVSLPKSENLLNLSRLQPWSFSHIYVNMLKNEWKKSFQTEKLSHCDLDERALDALKEFPVEGALAVLKQFLESNLVRTSQRNLSAISRDCDQTVQQFSNKYCIDLCCVIVRSTSPTSPPTSVGWWRPTARRPEPEPPPAPTGREATRATRAPTRRRSRPSWTGPATAWTWRPDRGSTEDRRLAGKEPLLAMAVKWDQLPDCPQCLTLSFRQVFCGKIPKDIYEDELIPHFEKCGKIWDLRLMMDPMTGLNR